MTQHKFRRFFAVLISLSLLMGSIAFPVLAFETDGYVDIVAINSTVQLSGLGNEAHQVLDRPDRLPLEVSGDGFVEQINTGTWIRWSDVNLEGGIASFEVRYARGASTTPAGVEILVAEPGAPIGDAVSIVNHTWSAFTDGWGNPGQTTGGTVDSTVGGVRDVFVRFAHEWNFGGVTLTLSQAATMQTLEFVITPATAELTLQNVATGAVIAPETAGGTTFIVAPGTYAYTVRASGHSTAMGLIDVADEAVTHTVTLTVPQTTLRFAGLGDENHNRPNTGGPGGTHRDMEHEGPSTGWPGNWVGWIRPVAWIKYANVDILGGIEEYSVRFARGGTGGGNLFEVRIAPVGAGFEASVPVSEPLDLGPGTGGWGNPGRVVTQNQILPHSGGLVDVFAVFLAQEYNYGGLELVLRARDELVIPYHDVTISPRPYDATVTLMTLGGEVIAPVEPGSNVFNVQEGFYRYIVERDGFITREDIVMANASRRVIVVLLPDTGNEPVRLEAENAIIDRGEIVVDEAFSAGAAVGHFTASVANPNATFSNISHVLFENVYRPTTGIVQITVGYTSSVTADGQNFIGLRTGDSQLVRVPLNPSGRSTIYLDMWSGDNIIRVSNILGATAGTWVNIDYIEVHPDTTPGSVDPNEGDTRYIPPVNPIIRTIFTADPEAKVWPTAPNRLFIYPSRDRHPSQGCDFMDMYHVFWTDNMVDFVDAGEILRYNDLVAARNDPSTPHWDSMTPAAGSDWNRTFMWAPDAVYRDGWYYFYWPVPLNVNGGWWGRTWATGVVRSRYPDRNFEQIPVEEAHPGFRGYIHGLIGTNIDISVHVFPDPETGRDVAYFFVGGGQHFWQGRLKDNMVEIESIEIITCSNAASCNVKACQSPAGWVPAPDVAWYTPGCESLPPLGWYTQGHAAIHQRLPSFHEGPSMFRRAPDVIDDWNREFVGADGYIYYLIYPAGNEPGAGANRPKFDYSTGATPLGPWFPQGQFFGNVGGDTNHGSVIEFNGQWYMFYHTPDLSSGVGTERSTAVDRVEFNPNGSIIPFWMTREGVGMNGPVFTRPAANEYLLVSSPAATLSGGARVTSLAGAPSSDETIAIGLNVANGDGIMWTGVDGGQAHPETGRGNRAMLVFHYSTADVLPKMELLINGETHSYINFIRTGGRVFFADTEFTTRPLLPGPNNTIELRRGISNNQGTIHLSHIEVILFDDWNDEAPGWFDVEIEIEGDGTVEASLARVTDDTVQGLEFRKAAGSQILLEPVEGTGSFVGWEVIEPAGWEVVVREVTREVDGNEVTTVYHSVRMPYGELHIRAIFEEEGPSEEVVFNGNNPNVLRDLLDESDVILETAGNLGIFAHHSPFVVPAGRTLTVVTTLNVQANAELIIEGTLIVLDGGRINNQGGAGGTIIIENNGTLVNDGHVENVTNSTVTNNGTIVNNNRFEVRASTTFCRCNGAVIGDAPLNIHRTAITCDND